MRNIPVIKTLYLRHKQRRLRRRLLNRDTEEVFAEIATKKRWSSEESVSGPGSGWDAARIVANELPVLFKELAVSSVLDVPCGDFNWMRRVDLDGVDYIGAEIVEGIVESNREKYARDHIRFMHLNLIRDPLPDVDLILCRDCFVHFSHADIFAALKNISSSKASYLLTTTFTDQDENPDILTGQWLAVNLRAPPFCLPPPLKMINENYVGDEGRYPDKSLGLWSIEDIRNVPFGSDHRFL